MSRIMFRLCLKAKGIFYYHMTEILYCFLDCLCREKNWHTAFLEAYCDTKCLKTDVHAALRVLGLC